MNNYTFVIPLYNDWVSINFLLLKINKEFNISVICNLHQVDLATKYSDRIVGLLDGEIRFDQPASNIDKVSASQIYK